MLSWLIDWFNDIRIAADFAKAEASALPACVAEAQARFPTADLELEVKALMAAIRTEEERRFGQESRSLAQRIGELQQDLTNRQAMLAALTRDYKAQLEALYEEMNRNKAKLTELYEEKDAAYSDLEEAQEDLDRWYGKSERTFFGNGGKPLPRHSLFGQSLGDRDDYKSDRDDAGERIGECREAIGELKARNQAIYETIQRVKRERQYMFDLKQQGHTRSRVERESIAVQQAHTQAETRLRQLGAEREALVRSEKTNRGVLVLEERVAELHRKRAAWVAAFKDPSTTAARRQAHRVQWLKCHG